MTRLIDGDALIELINGGYDLDFDEVPETKRELLRMIMEQPTVDAEPVRHGKWIDEGYYADNTNVKAWHCSECNWHMLGYEDELFRYCPICGARMDKDETD
mgnify:CR=1 FL=1